MPHLELAPRRKLALVMTWSVYTARKNINYVQQVIYSTQDVGLEMAPSGHIILCSGNVELWKCDKQGDADIEVRLSITTHS